MEEQDSVIPQKRPFLQKRTGLKRYYKETDFSKPNISFPPSPRQTVTSTLKDPQSPSRNLNVRFAPSSDGDSSVDGRGKKYSTIPIDFSESEDSTDWETDDEFIDDDDDDDVIEVSSVLMETDDTTDLSHLYDPVSEKTHPGQIFLSESLLENNSRKNCGLWAKEFERIEATDRGGTKQSPHEQLTMEGQEFPYLQKGIGLKRYYTDVDKDETREDLNYAPLHWKSIPVSPHGGVSELDMFEKMEKLTTNQSFCSTASTVQRFVNTDLQITTKTSPICRKVISRWQGRGQDLESKMNLFTNKLMQSNANLPHVKTTEFHMNSGNGEHKSTFFKSNLSAPTVQESIANRKLKYVIDQAKEYAHYPTPETKSDKPQSAVDCVRVKPNYVNNTISPGSEEPIRVNPLTYVFEKLNNTQVLNPKQTRRAELQQNPEYQQALLAKRIMELEIAIQKHKTENSRLAKLRQSVEEQADVLTKEKKKFESSRTKELAILDDMRQRLKVDRNNTNQELVKARELKTSEEESKQQLATLRTQVTEVRKELQVRTSRWGAAARNFKSTIAELSTENEMLKKNVSEMKLKSLRDLRRSARNIKNMNAREGCVISNPPTKRQEVEIVQKNSNLHDWSENRESDNMKVQTERKNKEEDEIESKENCDIGPRQIFSNSGQCIEIRYGNGDVKDLRELESRGISKYYFKEANSWEITHPDGTQILKFGTGELQIKKPNGVREIKYANGVVRRFFPDGREEYGIGIPKPRSST